MKIYGGVDIQIHVFLASPLVGSVQFHALAASTPGESALDTHCIGDWVGPRTSMDDVEREKSCPYRDSKSNSQPSSP
jgi:hypothetical protein